MTVIAFTATAIAGVAVGLLGGFVFYAYAASNSQ
ncbi:hypothetical protein HNR55_001587 [Acetobacter lovaniensis]|jgi:hypothetical protein|uniref:Uncharacterized protein n=1 Tax=Acetobacter lovaniensis TaxID=104100 RepID=A0A841QFH8_9PROT|nr:hypothetical protein [Acetobacter lovaniensis]